MIPRQFVSDTNKIAYSSVGASYTAITLTRIFNWLEVINDTDQDVTISMDSGDAKERIIPSGHARVYEKDAYNVLRYKRTDSAPSSGNLYFNSEYRTYKK